jgi:hypothetical protein
MSGMHKPVLHRRAQRAWLLGFVLPAMLLRAFIPVGFMPASGAPLSIEICPEGFPAGLLTHADHRHHHDGQRHGRSEHCAFGTSCGGGPLAQQSLRLESDCTERAPTPSRTEPVVLVRLVQLPQARGPPTSV